jgi:hypothetical protein
MMINAKSQFLILCALSLCFSIDGVNAESAFDWPSSPYTWANSPNNPANSPYALGNSPYALENSPNSVNPSNGVFDGEGNRVGYYVSNGQGSTNVFDSDGNRQFYVPEVIPASIYAEPYNPNQLSNSPYAWGNSPYALENSPYSPNQTNAVFTTEGYRAGYVSKGPTRINIEYFFPPF